MSCPKAFVLVRIFGDTDELVTTGISGKRMRLLVHGSQEFPQASILSSTS